MYSAKVRPTTNKIASSAASAADSHHRQMPHVVYYGDNLAHDASFKKLSSKPSSSYLQPRTGTKNKKVSDFLKFQTNQVLL